MGISIEPGIIQKGTKYTFDSGDNNSAVIKYTYVQVPILGNFHLSEKIYISAGPEFSYLIKSKIFKPEKLFEISALIGLNYCLNEIMDIGFRYGHGITYTGRNIWTYEDSTYGGESKEFNQYIQIIAILKK